jgi:CTP-dependent riboflavin kinase
MVDEKLETLENIALDCESDCSELEKRLKQEAIKWIKQLNENNEIHESFIPEGGIIVQKEIVRNDSVIQWVKHFFNIREGDLK